MRLDAHFDMLPVRAFQKRGFGSAPATLEGGGKGGGGGPTSTTAYQTNLPEYAKPYVMNMLGAAQNQLFTTTPGVDGEPGTITGFKPYQAYSSSPTDYFAGPSSLQTSAYNAAAGMQSPQQFGYASNLAGTAGNQALGAQGQANQLMNQALGYGGMGAGYGQQGSMYGAQGAQQAGQTSQLAQQLAQMYGQQGQQSGLAGQYAAQLAAQQANAGAGQYGAMGAGYGAQAAGLAPEAQAYGQEAAGFGRQAANLAGAAQGYGQSAADIGQMGLRAEQLGRDVSQQARDYAAQQAATGDRYARGVTDPSQIAQYMSPYQQAVTDAAKSSATREAQIADTAAKLGAARQGTYGGARETLMRAEREKNLLANLTNIQTQGSQSAYDKAIAAQQFGANIGLQGLGGAQTGLGTALQGAQTGLSGLGTAMQGQQAGLSGLSQAGQLYGQGMQGAQAGTSALGQAGQLYGQGMQGAGYGLQGVGQQIAAGQLGLQGAQTGIQGAQAGMQGVGQQIAGGQLGLSGAQTGIQGAQAGMQGAGVGLSGVGQATGAGQYGLQGLGQATSAASTLGNLGTAQQGADINAINLQNTLGSSQQQYQQNIINQAIQDYATQQQYPYMQLSTMSNLLRGLPMQGMSTQQYQAQPSTAQQLMGLGGTAAMMGKAGLFKEGGSVGLGYANRGVVDSTRDRLEEMFSTDPEDTAKYVSQSTSPAVKKLARELGIGGAPTGGLGRNMAGGGIIAFSGKEGSQVEEMTDEEREAYIKNNEYLQRSRGLANFPGATAEFLRKYNPVTGSAYSEALQRFVNESPADQATRFRAASNRTAQAANPTQEVPAVKTATQRQEDNDRADVLASVGQYSKADYKKAEEFLKPPKLVQSGDKGDDKNASGNKNITGTAGSGDMGLEAIMAERRRLAGIEEGPGAKSAELMKMLEERQAGMGKERDSDRYLRAAEAFAKFGSTAGPMLGVASEALGGFAKGEAAARKEQDKMNVEAVKMQAELEKAQRLEAMGLVKEAQAVYDKLEDRKKDYDIARMQRDKPGEFDKMYAAYSQNEVDAGRKPTFEGFRKSLSASDDTGRLNAIFKADTLLANDTRPGGYVALSSSKKPEDREKAAQMRRDLIAEYMGAMGATQTAGAGSGNKLRFDKDGKQV